MRFVAARPQVICDWNGGTESVRPNGGSLRSPKPDGMPKDIVGGNPALAVGGSGERYLSRVAGNNVLDLDGVSDCIDVRVAGLQVFVDSDAATRPDFKTRIDRQLVFRAHTHSQDDQLGGHPLARL